MTITAEIAAIASDPQARRYEIEQIFAEHPRLGRLVETPKVQAVIARLASSEARAADFISRQREHLASVATETAPASGVECGGVTWGSAWEHEQSCNNPNC